MSSTTLPVWLRFCQPNCSGEPPARPYGASGHPLAGRASRNGVRSALSSYRDRNFCIFGLRQTFIQVSLTSFLLLLADSHWFIQEFGGVLKPVERTAQ